jgi:murein DD-endopeptidase MepM/ murein hydrolase activator NlpD
MRWLTFWMAVVACGQSFQVIPSKARQGQTLQVIATQDAVSARMNGRTISLFPQAEGGRLGLMPVPALLQPGNYPLEFLDSSGAVVHTTPVSVRDARFLSQNIIVGKAVAALRPAPDEMKTVAAFREAVSDLRYWIEPFAAPVPGCVTSPFGVRRLYNGKPSGNYHGGVDQRSLAGRPIRAVADGTVKVVRMFNLHGGTVGIDHGQGLVSIYLHMSKFALKEGTAVKKGEVIGYVGSTGRSTAPHLHWGLYANGVPVDPGQWVRLRPCAPAKPPARKARKR